jgi:membrane protein DedA with SNARE-associated domain
MRSEFAYTQSRMNETIELVAKHGYVLVFFWVLAEQAAIPIPSIPLLLISGSLARTKQLDLSAILFCALTASVIADNAWFQLGRRFRSKALHFICIVSLEPDSCVRKTENVFARYGLNWLLVSKFIPGLNAVAAPLAGASNARFFRFLFFDTLGALVWTSVYVFAGYLLSDELELAIGYASRFGSGFLLFVVAAFGGWIAWRFIERRRLLRSVKVDRIDIHDLKALLSRTLELSVVDVRSHLSYSDVLIPEALHIPLEELPTRHQEIPRDHDIVLVCT